jgi:cellulose synthase/poly-beta-1,6-N-acetylglucosamine synthase-like glycosyltransferase
MELVQSIAAASLWTCLALVFYAYVGYPLLLYVLARTLGRPKDPVEAVDEDLPSVSLLIAAYNEEAEIEKRIQTALMTDYPADRLEIVIASDGSSDATAEIVRRYAGRGVRLLDYRQRRGKAAVLNASFPELRGEIVLLSDANTQTDPQALRRIVRWFRDPNVGVVCGRLILTDPATGRNVDGLYWKYETFLKKHEGRLGALLGANGGIYAIRRSLQAPIPQETIVDDFVLPLQAKLRSGCSIVYESRAVAYEETPAAIGSEFHRRARIGAGGFQSIGLLWPLLHPRHGWTAFTFLSHKILRWMCPFFLLGMLLANLLLIGEPFYQGFLLGQAAFYLLSLLAAYVPARPRFLKPLRLTTMFTGMNAALFVGFWRWVRGTQKGAWKRTERLAEGKEAIGCLSP